LSRKKRLVRPARPKQQCHRKNPPEFKAFQAQTVRGEQENNRKGWTLPKKQPQARRKRLSVGRKTRKKPEPEKQEKTKKIRRKGGKRREKLTVVHGRRPGNGTGPGIRRIFRNGSVTKKRGHGGGSARAKTKWNKRGET